MVNYLTTITNYIFDSRFNQALLIDGNWGCGKTYFVKHFLVPEIEKKTVEHVKETETHECYKTLLVSLYGVSTIEAIQMLIYDALLEKCAVSDNEDKLQPVLKNLFLFGMPFLKGIAEHFNITNSVNDLETRAKEHFFSASRDSIVLIFDDVERCKVETIELMGFLNNLCENLGYRVILVANEGEISKKENEIAEAIQKQTALLDLYGKRAMELSAPKNDSTCRNQKPYLIKEEQKHRNEQEEANLRDTLNKHKDELFDTSTLYERTREKLIGLTIRFESRIEDAYEIIADSVVSESFKEYLIQQKSIIIDAFVEAEHQNLRTLISVFIAAESLVGSIREELPKEVSVKYEMLSIKDTIEEEKQRILSYLARTAILKAGGMPPHQWNTFRFGSINRGYTVDRPVFGYAFVDEYWVSLVSDCETMNRDFSDRVTELLELQLQRKHNDDHCQLSLFKLGNWYTEDDNDVKANLNRLKEELRDKKYRPQEFKEIIYILMCVNNTGFGMQLERSETKSSDRVYDTCEDLILPTENIVEESFHAAYENWDKENISEYVDLMLAYFEDEGFEMNKDMLRMLSSDSRFVKEYRNYIQPILDKIEENEVRKLRTSEEGIDLFDDQNLDFRVFFTSHKDTYLTKKQFFSLYGYERFDEFVLRSNAKGIFHLADAIRSVYDFSNLQDFFVSDYEVVNKLWTALKDDREGNRSRYNADRSRTREIALRRIESDFLKYKNILRDPQAED